MSFVPRKLCLLLVDIFSRFFPQETKNNEIYYTGKIECIYHLKKKQATKIRKKISQIASLNSVSRTYLENIIIPLSVNSELLFLIFSVAGS